MLVTAGTAADHDSHVACHGCHSDPASPGTAAAAAVAAAVITRAGGTQSTGDDINLHSIIVAISKLKGLYLAATVAPLT